MVSLSANPSYLPTEIEPQSRYLLHHWTKALATVVSMASGNENPFLVHLTPMLLRAPALRYAVSSMAAGHLAILLSDSSFDTVAAQHRLRAVSSLRQTIQSQDPELSLATILMLQVSDRLFTTDTKVDHLSGAKAVIAQKGGPAAWTGSSAQFLLSLGFYHDVLSSISRAASPLLDLHDAIPIEGQASMEGLASVLQLVGLISRMRGQSQEVHDAQGYMISEALQIIGDSEEPSGDVGHTTQAYKHAAFIYLNRVWRNEGAPHPSNLAHVERCLFHLSQVPITSPLVSGHSWPLWTAGCEAIDLQQRQFVRDRVDAMFQVRHLPSLRRVKTDIEDVWAFKDTQRSLSGVDNIDCIKAILRSRRREADIA